MTHESAAERLEALAKVYDARAGRPVGLDWSGQTIARDKQVAADLRTLLTERTELLARVEAFENAAPRVSTDCRKGKGDG